MEQLSVPTRFHRLRPFFLYITIAVGVVMFGEACAEYIMGPYRDFIRTAAFHASSIMVLLPVFAESGLRFMCRLGYVIGFVALAWRIRGAVYLILAVWLTQLVPGTIFALSRHMPLEGSWNSFLSLLVFLGLAIVIWPLLKRGRPVLFCTLALCASLALHVVAFASFVHAYRPAAVTEDTDQQDRFFRAVQSGDADTVHTMLAEGSFHPRLRGVECNPNTICNLLSYAVGEKGQVEIVAALQRAGSLIDEPDGGTGDTPLMRALFAHRPDIAEYLAESGADPMRTNRFGVPELIVASGEGSPKLLEIFIARGAPVDLRETMPDMLKGTSSMVSGITPLMMAAYSGRPDLVRTLLDNGADRALKDSEGHTVMDYATGSPDKTAGYNVQQLLGEGR